MYNKPRSYLYKYNRIKYIFTSYSWLPLQRLYWWKILSKDDGYRRFCNFLLYFIFFCKIMATYRNEIHGAGVIFFSGIFIFIFWKCIVSFIYTLIQTPVGKELVGVKWSAIKQTISLLNIHKQIIMEHCSNVIMTSCLCVSIHSYNIYNTMC